MRRQDLIGASLIFSLIAGLLIFGFTLQPSHPKPNCQKVMMEFDHDIGQFVLATFQNDSRRSAIYKSRYERVVMDGHLCFPSSFIDYIVQNG
jgi:hypothetical protein